MNHVLVPESSGLFTSKIWKINNNFFLKNLQISHFNNYKRKNGSKRKKNQYFVLKIIRPTAQRMKDDWALANKMALGYLGNCKFYFNMDFYKKVLVIIFF